MTIQQIHETMDVIHEQKFATGQVVILAQTVDADNVGMLYHSIIASEQLGSYIHAQTWDWERIVEYQHEHLIRVREYERFCAEREV